MNKIPNEFIGNEISELLYEVRLNYGKLTRKGYIAGIMTIDQDAKIIAVNPMFDKKLIISI